MNAEKLIERAVTDAEFRSELFANPTDTVTKYGYDLSDDQMNALSSMSHEDLVNLAEDLDERLSKGCCYTCGAGCVVLG